MRPRRGGARSQLLENPSERAFVLLHFLSLLEKKKKEVQEKLSSERLGLAPELHARIAVLQNLCYIDDNFLVTLKGRCGCFVAVDGVCEVAPHREGAAPAGDAVRQPATWLITA